MSIALCNVGCCGSGHEYSSLLLMCRSLTTSLSGLWQPSNTINCQLKKVSYTPNIVSAFASSKAKGYPWTLKWL